MQALQSRRLFERASADFENFSSFYIDFIFLADFLFERSLIDGKVCGSMC